MSCTVALSPSATHPSSFVPRKRTMSFSTPTQTKAARTPLRRTGSFLSLADMQNGESTPLYGRSGPTKNYTSSDSLVIGQYDARMRKRRTSRPSTTPTTSTAPPQPSSSQIYLQTSRRTTPRPRRSSPLAPEPRPLPERPSLPCTKKREPDLYRTAIETRMRMSPVGRNILNMGPRIAMSIITATEALESLVAAHSEPDFGDITMTTSWVDLGFEEWEMVEGDA